MLRSATAAAAAAARLSRALRLRCFAAVHHGQEPPGKNDNAMADQIVDYASSLRKKGEAGYLDAMQVLQHGLSFMSDSASPGALCKVQLTVASFHADQGKLSDAADALASVANNTSASLEVRACALEALAGVQLQLHQDDLAVEQCAAFSKLISSHGDAKPTLVRRSAALAGLVKLAEARYEEASSCFQESALDRNEDVGSCALAHAEFLHVRGRSAEAKKMYEDAIAISRADSSKAASFSAPTLAADEVHVAALAGLGQLSTELGTYNDAEKSLTEALHSAETISGEAHMRVGLVLSCMANLYSRRAKSENTGFMIAEGLYRRSLNLLKAPPLEKVPDNAFQAMDVTALTRARYGDVLSLADQRQTEGTKLKSWAAGAWKNRRPLAEALHESGHTVIDVRFGRVF